MICLISFQLIPITLYKGSINKSVKIFKEIKEWDRYLKKKIKKEKNLCYELY